MNLAGTTLAALRAMPIAELALAMLDLDPRLCSAPIAELAERLADPPPPPFDVANAARAFVGERLRSPRHKRLNALREMEEAIIRAALAETGENVSAAARLLNVERKALERRARRCGVR